MAPPSPTDPARMKPPPDPARLRQSVLKRLAALENERQSWLSHWREISRHILPRRGRFLAADRNRGGRRNRAIIDNTATLALRAMASGLMGGITSPARPWFRLAAPGPALERDEAVQVWLSDVTELLQTIFARSNLYDCLASAYEELAAFGTAAILVFEDFDDVISCESLTVGQYCLGLGAKGDVDSLYRRQSVSIAGLVAQFAPQRADGGRDWSRLSLASRRAFEEGRLDDWVELVQAIEPNPDFRPGPGPADVKPFRSVWIELNGDSDRVLRQSGFDRFPALCPRWNVTAPDIYGTSPAMDCLGDVEQLQAMEREKALAIQKMVRPPLVVGANLRRDSAVNPLPDGTTFFDPAAGQAMAQPLYQVQPRLGELAADLELVRGRIRSAFLVDLWRMFDQIDHTGITATEIEARREEKLLMLGPVLERLHHELLDPLIARCFAIAAAAGLVPPPPEPLAGLPAQVHYTSVLAAAQRAGSVAAIERLSGFVGNLAAADQGVLDNLDLDEAVGEYARAIGVPPRVMRDDQAIEQVRAARAQAAQQQQAMQGASLLAQNAQVLSQTDTTRPSALTDLLGGITGAGL